MMKRLLGAAAACSATLLLVQPAVAGPAEDACAALMEARGALVSLINAGDKAARDDQKAKVAAASTKLDQVLAGMSGADAKAAGEFKPVWEQFKATREGEIIPAVYAGKVDDAKKLATGVQAERLAKMRSIMSCK